MQKIVISLGGSTIVPGKIDQDFIQGFSAVINDFVKSGNKVVIVTGGGIIAREYIKVMRNSFVNSYDQSQVGIYATRLNAALVYSFFKAGKLNISESMSDFKKKFKRENIVVLGGLSPAKASTSDATAAEIAKEIGAKKVINVTNVDGLYNKNPMLNRNVKLIPYISHKDFYDHFIKKMKYDPGQHFVFDQDGAEICRKHKIEIIVLKGLKNLEKCLNNQEFIGTIIS